MIVVLDTLLAQTLVVRKRSGAEGDLLKTIFQLKCTNVGIFLRLVHIQINTNLYNFAFKKLLALLKFLFNHLIRHEIC